MTTDKTKKGMGEQGVDVLALMRIIQTASTGSIASRARLRPRAGDGRLVMHQSPKTPVVLRALKAAERDGLVRCMGAHAELYPRWGGSGGSAAGRELYWTVTAAGNAALSTIRSTP